MKLSIVTSLYNSSSSVEAFYRRAVAAAQNLTQDFEIVMVDDGSPDDSLKIACALAKIAVDEEAQVAERMTEALWWPKLRASSTTRTPAIFVGGRSGPAGRVFRQTPVGRC